MQLIRQHAVQRFDEILEAGPEAGRPEAGRKQVGEAGRRSRSATSTSASTSATHFQARGLGHPGEQFRADPRSAGRSDVAVFPLDVRGRRAFRSAGRPGFAIFPLDVRGRRAFRCRAFPDGLFFLGPTRLRMITLDSTARRRQLSKNLSNQFTNSATSSSDFQTMLPSGQP